MHLLKFLKELGRHFSCLLKGLEVVEHILLYTTSLRLIFYLRDLLLLCHLPLVLYILFLFVLLTLHIPDLTQLDVVSQPLVLVLIVNHIC